MTRSVFCKKHQRQLEGLSKPPYPGLKGQEIFDHVSSKAWQEWQAHQTMLINEHQLNMMEPSARKFLQEEMDKFMAGEDFAKAEGYIPPTTGNN
jgi:Fe-S cluster biosynthesis and repair protein YggX